MGTNVIRDWGSLTDRCNVHPGLRLEVRQTHDEVEVGMPCLAVPQFLVNNLLVPLTYRFCNRMNVCLPCGATDATESWEATAETDCHPDVVAGVTFGHNYTYALTAIGHQHGSTFNSST